MKSLGFLPTKNSGSGWIEKEDGTSEHCICQLKSTDKKSISVKQDDLITLVYNANVSHKVPVFAVQFLNTDEVWLMVRPEDLQDVQDIVTGQYEKSVQKEDFTIDIEQDKCYNTDVSIDNKKREHSIKKYRKRREERYKELERNRKRRR